MLPGITIAIIIIIIIIIILLLLLLGPNPSRGGSTNETNIGLGVPSQVTDLLRLFPSMKTNCLR